MRKVLVTGGAGYVGSHAAKALSQAGYTPVVFDNLVYGHRDAVRFGPLVEGDLLDRSALAEVFRDFQPEAVLHFAAYAYVGESVSDPGKYYRNNVLGSLNLLDAARENSVNRIVFSSTCATYGNPIETPITESHPQSPINPYGQSKLMVERMLRDYDFAYGIRSVALRYFNAAGADESGELGEDHSPETHLIPLVLDAAIGQRESITVHGRDYPTSDGTCVRDYVHVTDLADAHVRSLRYLEAGGASSAFNLSTGTGCSVEEVIQSARRVTGRDIHVVEGSRRIGDPPALVGDATQAQRELNWSPQYRDIDSIIASAWRWHQLRHGR
jgi:UDP-glucose-4-epimerase GalE